MVRAGLTAIAQQLQRPSVTNGFMMTPDNDPNGLTLNPHRSDLTHQYCLLLATQYHQGQHLTIATQQLLEIAHAQRVSVLTLLQ